MDKQQAIFKRYEKKYLLDEGQYQALRRMLAEQMQPDAYAETDICNIYFDTPDSRLIRTSLEKPVYKEKLRLRSYGTPKGGDKVFIELKKKYKGVVYKRRAVLPLCEAENYLYSRIPPRRQTQILKEIDWFLGFYPGLQPALYLGYHRLALRGIDDASLRITFDGDICYRKEQLLLEAGMRGDLLLKQGQRLMEIKMEGAMPLWLSHMLNLLQIYPISFSKYGRCYLLELEQMLKGGQCSA